MSSENIIGLLYDMCRLCLERIGRHSVFASVDLPMEIAECAGVQVGEGDGLPETMCEVCAERLRMCRAFRRLAARSDARLRALHARARGASESDAEYESIIPEIVMDIPDTYIEEETQPVVLNTADSKESPGGVSRIIVRSDLFSDQPGTSGEIHKESNPKRKAPTPGNTEIINNLQSEVTRPKRRRMAAIPKKNCTKVQENSSNEMEIRFKKPSVKDEDDLTCEICMKECATPKALYLHRRSHIKRYHCSLCEKAFSSNGDLTKHVRTHTGERPYVCDVCGKAFAQNVSLKLHYNVHIKLEYGIASKKGRPAKTKAAEAVKTEEESLPTLSETVANVNEKGTFGTANDTLCNTHDGNFEAESVHVGSDDDRKSNSKMVNGDSSEAYEIDPSEDHVPSCEKNNPSDIIDVTGVDDTENSENYPHPEQCTYNEIEGSHPDARDMVVNNLVKSTFFCQDDTINGVRSDANLHKKPISKKPYACDICNKKFKDDEKFQKHKTKHEKQKPCIPNETVSALADSTNDDSIATATNYFPSDSNDDRCLITSSETTEAGEQLISDSRVHVVNMNGADSPDSIGCGEGIKGDSNGDSDSARLVEEPLCIKGPLEEGPSNQKVNHMLSVYQCDKCQKTYSEEKQFESHKKRHLKRVSTSVSRFC